MLNKWQELEKLEEDLAVAKGQLADLTHFRKIVLAEQLLKAQEEGAKSVAAADAIARNSKEYRDVVIALAKITEEEARYWFKYKRVARQMGVL